MSPALGWKINGDARMVEYALDLRGAAG